MFCAKPGIHHKFETGGSMKAELIYFSATGTTKKIVRAFSEGLGFEPKFTDITLPANHKAYQPVESDLMVIAAPVYGERIPAFVLDFTQPIQGDGKPLVVIAIYGNIGYGISFNQFENFARQNNFRLIAAGAFIGEHTYARENAPVGLGRPDQMDLAHAAEFGEQVRLKINSKTYHSPIISPSTLPEWITKFPDSGVRFLVRQPAVNESVCNQCGACARRCPMGAIDPQTLSIDETLCIRCYACVKICPVSARTEKFRLQFFEGIFSHLGKNRKENQIFL